jgi:outer membrane protein
MYRVFIFLFSIVFTSLISHAQTYTLQQCIDSALANNIPVKQKYLTTQSAEVDWRQSKTNLLPSLEADIYHYKNQGRSIDPSSNGYVNQSLNSANYILSSGVTVFNGGSLHNNIKQSATNYEASKMEWQQSKDNLVLEVMADYLMVLNNEDLLLSATKQADVTQKQLERSQVLDKQGAIKPSEVFDLKGQLMNDQLAIVSARNALETAKVNLSVLMNQAYDSSMKLERIDITEFLTAYNKTSKEVYTSALQQFSAIKAVELRTKAYEYGAKSARGALYPTLSLGGGVGSNYSSIAQNASGKISYDTQLLNNISSSIGVIVSIPIFNRLKARNLVKQADITYKNSMLTEENTKLQLHQQVDQAYLNMTNAYERYKVLLEQVNAYEESFKAAEVRFNAGVGTSIDYLTAKDKLDRANINLISSRYEFVLRKKILDFYSNSGNGNK